MARFLENHLRIPSRGHLMVIMNFQNSKFHFFLTTMKFPKNFEKKSSCSKIFFWHRKLNDGSPGHWEKYYGVGNVLQRSLKLHLKIFLEAHFSKLQGVTQNFKKFLLPNTSEFRAETCTYERWHVCQHPV